MSFHADVEGLEASAKDPGVEGGEGGAGTAAEEINFIDQFFFPDDSAAEDAALAVEPFGCRVDDEVGAEFDGESGRWVLQSSCRREEQLVFTREGGRRLPDR